MAATGWDSWDDYNFNPPQFQEFLRCIPFSQYKHPHLESGDKIVLPPSSLARILNLHPRFPLIFRLERESSVRFTHCGVLEFDAEEGSIYMPQWMMRNLDVVEGDGVVVRDAELARGAYMKLQPHAAAFVELSSPRAVLERTLRSFTCLTRGDTIMIRHDEREFWFDVLEVAPGTAISLVDTDCVVDFAAALDCEEAESEKKKEKVEEEKEKEKEEENEKEKEKEVEVTSFRAFMGTGRRLDGKEVATAEEEKGRKEDGGKEEGDGKFKPFTGRSRLLGRRL